MEDIFPLPDGVAASGVGMPRREAATERANSPTKSQRIPIIKNRLTNIAIFALKCNPCRVSITRCFSESSSSGRIAPQIPKSDSTGYQLPTVLSDKNCCSLLTGAFILLRQCDLSRVGQDSNPAIERGGFGNPSYADTINCKRHLHGDGNPGNPDLFGRPSSRV